MWPEKKKWRPLESSWKSPKRSKLSHNLSRCREAAKVPTYTHTSEWFNSHTAKTIKASNANSYSTLFYFFTHNPPSFCSVLSEMNVCLSFLLSRGEIRSCRSPFGGLLQVSAPAVTMPTSVRRRPIAVAPNGTWWGPAIISSSLWSPVNGAMELEEPHRNGMENTQDWSPHQREALSRTMESWERETGGGYISLLSHLQI